MPNYIFAHTCLASCYALMDKLEEAHAEAEEVLKNPPKLGYITIIEVSCTKF